MRRGSNRPRTRASQQENEKVNQLFSKGGESKPSQEERGRRGGGFDTNSADEKGGGGAREPGREGQEKESIW